MQKLRILRAICHLYINGCHFFFQTVIIPIPPRNWIGLPEKRNVYRGGNGGGDVR